MRCSTTWFVSVVLRPIKMFAWILDISFAVSNLGSFDVNISFWMSCKWTWLYYNLWYWLRWHSNWICWGKMIHQEMKRIEHCPSMIVCHFTFKTVDQRFLSLSKICCFNCLMFGTRFSVESLKLLYLFEFMQMLHNGRMCSPHLIDRGWFSMKSWQM